MSVKNITGMHGESIGVSTSGNTWHLHKGAAINAANFGFDGQTGTTNNIFNIDGDIHSAAGGVFCGGNRLTVNVGATGSIVGKTGVYMDGSGQLECKVDGRIVASQYGIFSTSEETRIKVGKTGSLEGLVGMFSTGATKFAADIDGHVFGAQYGISAAAANARVHVGNHGAVDAGETGVDLTGGNATVVNDGTISGVNYGIHAAEPGLEVRNTGEISGQAAVYGAGDGGLIVNGKGGIMSGALFGIIVSTNAGDDFRIVNHGTVLGGRSYGSLTTGAGDEQIVSDGRLFGTVTLGEGNDQLNVLHGSVNGSIYGGDGNDTLITDKAAHKLIEAAGEGVDTVRSTVSYTLSDYVEQLFLIGNKDIDGFGTDDEDILHGNSGGNNLHGKAGSDHLSGHAGNDQLFGGGDRDYFQFSTGDGHDTIMDFEDTVDFIYVSDWGPINNIGNVLSHAHNQGGGVIIEAGGDSLFIKGIEKADLDAMDFIF